MKKLLRAGCQPYFQMLEMWLAEGSLDDPFQEFMVCCDMVSSCAELLHHAMIDVRKGCRSALAVAASSLPSLDKSHALGRQATIQSIQCCMDHSRAGLGLCRMLSTHTQAVGRDAVTPDNHSGFWHQRYTLRGAASASGGKQSRLPGAEPGVKYHPVFLENLKDTILTTGVPVFLVTSCVCLL